MNFYQIPRMRFGLVCLALLAGGGALLALWLGWAEPLKGGGPLEGELTVYIRPGEGVLEPLPVEQAGAVPVRAGGSMSLEVKLKEPAFAYLVWLNSEGKVAPLYPWNNQTLEVDDINQPPPVRRSAKVLFSPLGLGSGWPFGSRGGTETVLLLARRTPLPENTQLGTLLGSLPAETKSPHPKEVVIMGLGGAAKEVSMLTKSSGTDEEARTAAEPLRAMLVRLQPHFELIRAVQFAHEGG